MIYEIRTNKSTDTYIPSYVVPTPGSLGGNVRQDE